VLTCQVPRAESLGIIRGATRRADETQQAGWDWGWSGRRAIPEGWRELDTQGRRQGPRDSKCRGQSHARTLGALQDAPDWQPRKITEPGGESPSQSTKSKGPLSSTGVSKERTSPHLVEQCLDSGPCILNCNPRMADRRIRLDLDRPN
jgi:hypothetical protein